jgi:hypothetical protein
LVFAADPLVGTWKLNVAKSTFSPGPPPKSNTLTVTEENGWIVSKSERISATGETTTGTNKYKIDGKEYPFEGAYGKGMACVKKTGEREVTIAQKFASGNTVTQKAVLSADGKTRTLTSTGKNEKGQIVNSRTVYERQ